ncbi:uncharacterized protein IL334_002258 [Kwoniella shivajii]|uniref:Cytoplasmic protein n=1 Tax=Kwoniella shivajii TaxID=564305 RepID=A0ABZ1CVU9_9TREE|nr:hypothetical protein IL334_002258 [Kwoniella shivajii]
MYSPSHNTTSFSGNRYTVGRKIAPRGRTIILDNASEESRADFLTLEGDSPNMLNSLAAAIKLRPTDEIYATVGALQSHLMLNGSDWWKQRLNQGVPSPQVVSGIKYGVALAEWCEAEKRKSNVEGTSQQGDEATVPQTLGEMTSLDKRAYFVEAFRDGKQWMQNMEKQVLTRSNTMEPLDPENISELAECCSFPIDQCQTLNPAATQSGIEFLLDIYAQSQKLQRGTHPNSAVLVTAATPTASGLTGQEAGMWAGQHQKMTEFRKRFVGKDAGLDEMGSKFLDVIEGYIGLEEFPVREIEDTESVDTWLMSNVPSIYGTVKTEKSPLFDDLKEYIHWLGQKKQLESQAISTENSEITDHEEEPTDLVMFDYSPSDTGECQPSPAMTIQGPSEAVNKDTEDVEVEWEESNLDDFSDVMISQLSNLLFAEFRPVPAADF